MKTYYFPEPEKYSQIPSVDNNYIDAIPAQFMFYKACNTTIAYARASYIASFGECSRLSYREMAEWIKAYYEHIRS